MSKWDQDGSWEEMMPALRNTHGSTACPDAETLSAVIDGKASDFLREALTAHIGQCPTCVDLRDRLVRFQQEGPSKFAAEWPEAEEGLDRWLETFLGQDEIKAQSAGQALPPQRLAWWKRLNPVLYPRRVQWAFGAVAGLTLTVGIFIMQRGATPLPPQILADLTPTDRKAMPFPEVAQTFVEKPDAESKTNSQGSPPAALKTAAIAADQVVRQSEPAAVFAPGFPPAEGQPTLAVMPLAETRPPESVRPELAAPIIAGPIENSRARTAANAPEAPRAGTSGRTGGSPLTQTTRGEAPWVRTRAPLTNSRLETGVTLSGAMSHVPPHTPPPASTAADGSGSLPPAFVRLDAGTRVWISLTTVDRKSAGEFVFRGKVLLPVTQASVVVLGRDTEVFGSAKVSQSGTTLRITELIWGGAHFGLSGRISSMNVQTSGTGGTVVFDSGRVLELWLASTSVYQRASGDSGRARQ